MNKMIEVKHDSFNNLITNELLADNVDFIDDLDSVPFEILEDLSENIPVIKQAYSLYKSTVSIRDKFFIKKLTIFLKELRNGDINENKLQKFRIKISGDQKYKDKVIDYLIVYLDSIKDKEKSKFIARLFKKFIEEKFTWEEFEYLVACVDSMLSHDFITFEFICQYNQMFNVLKIREYVKILDKKFIYASVLRLATWGFIVQDGINEDLNRNNYKLTVHGVEFGKAIY